MTPLHRVVDLELLRVWLGLTTRQGALDWAAKNGLEPLPERGPRGKVFYAVNDVFDAQDRADARDALRTGGPSDSL